MRSRLRSDPDQFELAVFDFELKDGEPAASSFEWEEDGDEFRYNGSIYDVVEKKITGNKLWIRCIDDKKEAEIIKKIEGLQKNEQGNKSSGSVPMQQLLSLLLFNEDNRSEPVTLVSALHHIDHYIESFNLIIIDIQSPPPRKVLLFTC